MPRSDNPVFAWVEALDELSYYELFGLDRLATADEIHEAFHVFCDTFHPDGHVDRDDAERRALSTIFKRGTEAYSVLSDAGLRGDYDAQLAQAASPRPPRVSFSPLSRHPSRAPGVPASLEESVRSPAARPFARKAQELIGAGGPGDLKQAKLQLVMANHMDPGNAVLEQAILDVESKLNSLK